MPARARSQRQNLHSIDLRKARLAPCLLNKVRRTEVMVESVTASLAAAIIAIVLVVRAITRAVKRRADAHAPASRPMTRHAEGEDRTRRAS